jgi:hypothetical protein
MIWTGSGQKFKAGTRVTVVARGGAAQAVAQLTAWGFDYFQRGEPEADLRLNGYAQRGEPL